MISEWNESQMPPRATPTASTPGNPLSNQLTSSSRAGELICGMEASNSSAKLAVSCFITRIRARGLPWPDGQIITTAAMV